MNFESFIDTVIAKEQGFCDNPADHGGPTNFGITEVVARANGYTGQMCDMPESFAREVYRKRYIAVPMFDKVAELSPSIGAKMIDAGVNMGPGTISTMLQRWLNALNARGSRYPDMFVDGRIGQVTLDALSKFLRWRGADGERVLLNALNSTQAVRYLEIAERDQTQEDFLYGWLLNRAALGV